MATILLFLANIVVVVHTFQRNMIERLQELYKQYSYAGSVKEVEQGESDNCSVCLSQMCKGEKIRSLPLCNHKYHADCIDAWLKNHTTCPLCRNKITDHISHNQHKQVKPFKESLVNLIQSFSDVLVALIYTMLPSSFTETFPLVH